MEKKKTLAGSQYKGCLRTSIVTQTVPCWCEDENNSQLKKNIKKIKTYSALI